jgi:methionyl-tRNA formyltransferase
LKTVEAIADKKIKTTIQDESLAIHHAPKIFKETCEINWNKTAKDIHNLIRGLSPYPAAWTQLDGKICKIFKSEISDNNRTGLQPGEFQTDNKKELVFQTGSGSLKILELQLEGKKKLEISDFLRGYKLP